MNDVPYAFSQSVAALLPYPALLENRFPTALWQQPIDEQIKHRVDVTLRIGCDNGGAWSYVMFCKGDEFTFEEVRTANSRHFRIEKICISAISYAEHATFEEITELVTFIVPFVNYGSLIVDYRRIDAEDDFSKLLTLFQNSPFAHIDVKKANCAQFIASQLKSSVLQKLLIDQVPISAALKPAFEEFALEAAFELASLRSKNLKFDYAFFERLFERSLDRDYMQLVCYFSFDFEELGDFKKELQIETDSYKWSWRREDGVSVHVDQRGGRLFTVEFEIDN